MDGTRADWNLVLEAAQTAYQEFIDWTLDMEDFVPDPEVMDRLLAVETLATEKLDERTPD